MHGRERRRQFKLDILMKIGNCFFCIDKPDLVIENGSDEIL